MQSGHDGRKNRAVQADGFFHYKLRAAAALPKIRFQDLRHSAASLLHASGVPSEAIRQLLGHASVRTTEEIYTHLTTDLERAAAEKMDEIVSA